MKVYHGTVLSYAMDISNNGIDLNKSKQYLDFGRGFYTTPDLKMAEDMAKRVSVFVERTKKIKYVYPAVLSFEYEEKPDLNYKIFDCESIEWAKFIMANRVTPAIADEMGLFDSNIDLKYDIIIGGTADGNIAGIASDLRFGRMNLNEYEIQLSDFLKKDGSSYGTQIVFCTDKAVSCIEYVKCDII